MALLQQLQTLAERLEPAEVSAHSEPIFAFILGCLDVRRAPPPTLSQHGDVLAVEDAALQACTACVLKLSELRFTPLFLTALEWSRAHPDSTARRHSLFRLACSLCASLRSVFVPFFRHMLADAVACLEATEGAPPPASKKARRSGAGGGDALDGLRLRTEVVRALYTCFLHDTVGFVDEPRFAKLMPPLLAQLSAPLPAGASEEEVEAMDAVLVQCLPQMAKAAVGQDMLWRQLNRGVLMETRSQALRPRRLGLAIVTQLVELLAEEYLILLPETLPFLSELVEDSDEGVEAAARGLLDRLSTLADEDVGELLRMER